ncbi:hypothetical protein ACIBEJ_24600 [Nonomuraea sp. NPDC050790]|uniref:hypothetical protein n=1 Tax=Nonomuraea sp. NPDC050790 TaxID=3364371 RepID=UPI00379827E1
MMTEGLAVGDRSVGGAWIPGLEPMSRYVLLLLICLSLVGCGSPLGREAEPPGQRANPTSEEEAEAPGAPTGGGGDAEAYGAPIEVPAKGEDEGRPLNTMLRRIKAEIRRQCPRHDLCVKLRIEAHDRPGRSVCQYLWSDPPPKSKVRQGSTIVIITGREPCPTPETSTPTPTVEESSAPESPEEPEISP